MKHLKTISLLFFFIVTGKLFAGNPGDAIFSGVQVHTIKLWFTQPNYWDSLVYYYNQGLEQMMQASAEVNGIAYPIVGVRLKGNSSFSYTGNKKSIKINFDEYLTDQRWDGLKGVHLNNMWGDPSFMREKLHLDFCRDAGINAPRGNYTRVFINDTLWGLYSLVEHVDKIFLKTHYNDKSGDLFKAVDAFTAAGPGGGGGGTPPGGGLPPGGGPGDPGANSVVSDFKWYGTDDTSYTNRYELKTEESTTAWPTLISFIDSLNNYSNSTSFLSSRFNVKNFYNALTTDILFANLDAYVNSGRNFYLYFLPNTKIAEWIVWDASLSFGAYSMGISKPDSISVLYVVNSTSRPLINKIYESPILKAEYLQSFNNIFKNYFSPARLFPLVDTIANTIRSYVNEDQKKMYTMAQFETNITSDLILNGGAPNPNGGGQNSTTPGIKSFITARYQTVQAQLKNLLTEVNLNASGISSPPGYKLLQNYPNPFNPVTSISFSLPKESFVTLKIFDPLGREVAVLINEKVSAGTHSKQWNAIGLPSGVYFYRLQAESYTETRKLNLLK